MVYETDFYTVRRPYTRPNITSYSVTSPRHYVVVDAPERPRRAEEQYSYSYNSKSETVRGSGVPSRNYSSSSQTVSRSAGGPGSYSYSTERSSRSSDYPGSYHSSYSSTTSGRLPHGTTYRHFSYRAPRISVTTWKVKPSIRTSVLIGELDRIHHRSRPHLSYVPTEDFLCSRPLVDFDDETKSIRAETERLMRRIYTSIPHPRNTTPLQILPYYGHHAAEKYTYPRHINTVTEDIFNMSHYNEPSARTIGRGHLACVSFAGGRGYPRRKHLYSDENRDIQDEIKFRSYYNKNRSYEDAMSLPTGFASYLLRLQPDNRNGTLTSSEKLHIINILKERKDKNKVSDDKVLPNETINNHLEKKSSSYKSKSVDETTERETKLNRSKSRDSKPFETCKKESSDTMETTSITGNIVKETKTIDKFSEITSRRLSENINKSIIYEEPHQKQSAPVKTLSSSPIVTPTERTIEIKVEPKTSEESVKDSSKPSHKISKTKTHSVEEKELKITYNESVVKPEEEHKEIPKKETRIEQENFQAEQLKQEVRPESAKTQQEAPKEEFRIEPAKIEEEPTKIEEEPTKIEEEPTKIEEEPTNIEEEPLKQGIRIEPEIKQDEATKEECKLKQEKAEDPKESKPPAEKVEVVKEEQMQDSNTIEASQSTTPVNLEETQDEPNVTMEVTQGTDEDFISISTKNINTENIPETVSNDTQEQINEKSVIIHEQTIEKNDIEGNQDESKDTNTTIQESVIGSIQQIMTETTQQTIFESSQVIVSSTNQESTEAFVSTGFTDSKLESIEDKRGFLAVEESCLAPDLLDETNILEQTKELPSENSQIIDTILSEQIPNESNTEFPTSTKEKIIEIQIERESTESMNMIEEIPDSISHDLQKESETEPVVEEPQSPELDLIYNNSSSNAVCEVLSDVPEEV